MTGGGRCQSLTFRRELGTRGELKYTRKYWGSASAQTAWGRERTCYSTVYKRGLRIAAKETVRGLWKELPSSKMAQSKTAIRKPEQGRYTATDVRGGKALDLSGEDNRTLIAYVHGQWTGEPAGESFLVSFLSPRLQEELVVALIHDPSTTAVGVSSLRCRFRHQQRQEWLVPRSSRLEGAASGGKYRSRHEGLPDMLGIGGHG